MANHTTTKLVGLIRNLKILCSWHSLHNYIYCTSKYVVDYSYSMLLGRPWLRDAKVAHDWGSNVVTIQRKGTIKIITVTKHLRAKIIKP
jgi:hypothetical protein